jgi:AraC-like DNA-binding protein
MSAKAVGASPVTDILLARKLMRDDEEYSFTATSLPGHLLHYIIRGRVHQQCNGRDYHLEPGKVLWYHEDEWVEGRVVEAPWEWYSINFIAPSIVPPPETSRLISPASPDVEKYFRSMIEVWDDEQLSAQTRAFRLHANLLQLLDLLTQSVPQSTLANIETTTNNDSRLWWELETKVRRDLARPLELRQLEEWSKCSTAKVSRAAQAAVGEPPMRRIKRIRLNFAQGLVRNSALSFSEIAARVGYPRVHEFSRDYKRWFGVTPTEDRARIGDV